MKRLRGGLLAADGFSLLAGALFWMVRPAVFRTLAECVEALCESSRSGDVRRYLLCLAEPLRSEARQRFRD